MKLLCLLAVCDYDFQLLGVTLNPLLADTFNFFNAVIVLLILPSGYSHLLCFVRPILSSRILVVNT